MFNWEKLKDMGINKAHKDHLIDLSRDGIHCNQCGEHLSQHGERKGGPGRGHGGHGPKGGATAPTLPAPASSTGA